LGHKLAGLIQLGIRKRSSRAARNKLMITYARKGINRFLWLHLEILEAMPLGYCKLLLSQLFIQCNFRLVQQTFHQGTYWKYLLLFLQQSGLLSSIETYYGF
jgi:hypothetical protein